jgi:asparagine synthase (glutamine-hydrolysing)
VTTSLATALAEVEKPTVDWEWTRSYLAGRWPEAGRTPYAEITLLPPGLLAVTESSGWHSEQLDQWRWVEDVPGNVDESAERFRALFDDAVRRRLLSTAAGSAVTTSGGLDSSSVLVTARHVAPDRPLIALALRFTDARGDERGFQEAVAKAAGAQLVWVETDETPGPFGHGPDELLDEHSGPPLIGNWFLHAAVRRRAEDLGIGRVLDGEDGDGVVGGDPTYLADLVGRGRLIEWALETTALSRVHGGNLNRLVRRSLGQARSAMRAGQLGHLHQQSVRGLVQGGYLSSVTAEAHRMWAGLPGGIGHPFLDRQLMEYAIAVPPQQRLRRGRSKVLLRRAMDGRLPQLVADRNDKANLAHPFVSALLGPQRPLLEEGIAIARTGLARLAGCSVPILTPGMSADTLYSAYRYASVAYWFQRMKQI